MRFVFIYAMLFFLLQGQSHANVVNDNCLLNTLKTATDKTTVVELKDHCQQKLIEKQANFGVVSKRFAAEEASQFNAFVLTPHQRNYLLPLTITNNVNKQPYQSNADFSDNLENSEVKYQFSIKVPLNSDKLLFEHDRLYFGMTLVSWWQIYADNISKPFRETNYQPEIFYMTPTNWHPFGGNFGIMVGIVHQSNGSSQILSRSWNRLYSQFIFEKGNLALAFRPWYRLEEDKKADVLSPEGDDNPDIEDYMGKFEFYAGYKWENLEVTAMARQNFATHNGAMQLDFTFPISGKMLGYIQYFNGYGESLIDYNHRQQKIGLGIALTNYF